MDAPWAGPITLDSHLSDVLNFQSMEGDEGLSSLFQFDIDVVSDHANLQARDILDSSVTVRLNGSAGDDPIRRWNGRVSRFVYLETGDDGLSLYRLTLRPWLWKLSLNSDCRVFQGLSVPEVARSIFQDRGFYDFDNELCRSYPLVDYVVQYRESDLTFLTRLFARVGIYYFFRHGDGRHTLVLADDPIAHKSVPGYEHVQFAPPDEQRNQTIQYVRRWHAETNMAPDRYALADFDFRKPRVPLYSSSRSTEADGNLGIDVYDFPGRFDSFAEGDATTRLRLEQVRANARTWAGESNARGLTVGCTFELENHPRTEENRRYLVTSAHLSLREDDYSSADRGAEEPFRTTLRVIDADHVFRPAPPCARAATPGAETATVVGPADEEIWVDRYGRVKVQFHWDREGRRDETASCWVRVAQAWAGRGWGAQFVPRIGDEVVIDFLAGDPDQPIVVGSVYNGANEHPFGLPGSKTQSGIRTRSTPGGTFMNGNEIRFEDLRGSEDLFVHAEGSQTTSVNRDQRATVRGNRSLSIAGTAKVYVGGGRDTNIGGNDEVVVQGSKKTAVGVDRELDVAGSRRTRVMGASETRIGGTESVTIAGGANREVLGAQATAIRGNLSETVQGSKGTSIDGDRVLAVAGSSATTVGVPTNATAECATFVWGSYRVSAQRTATIEAEEGVVLRCGSTELKLTAKSLDLLSEAISALGSKVSIVGSHGPSVHLDDTLQATSKQITLISSGARLALSDAAKLTGSKVQLGSGSGDSASSADPLAPKDDTVTLKFVGADHQPLAQCHYLLDVGGQSLKGMTADDGSVKVSVPPGAQAAMCTLWTQDDYPTGPRVAFRVQLQDVAAPDTVRGAQQRLQNMGYYRGKITGRMNYATRDALLVFQGAHDIKPTGLLGSETVAKLTAAHP